MFIFSKQYQVFFLLFKAANCASITSFKWMISFNKQFKQWINQLPYASKQAAEWLSEWMNEWMNERKNEWMNEWMNEVENRPMNEWYKFIFICVGLCYVGLLCRLLRAQNKSAFLLFEILDSVGESEVSWAATQVWPPLYSQIWFPSGMFSAI